MVMVSPDWENVPPVSKPVSPTTELEHRRQGDGELMLDCPNKGWILYSGTGKFNVTPCGDNPPGTRIDKGGPPAESHDFLAMLTRESHPPSSLISRGAEGDPNDAVVLLRDGDIHLAPALIRVLEGDYCFAIKSLDSATDRPPTEFHLKWEKSDEPEGLVKLPGVSPGVYALEKKNVDSSGTCSTDPKAIPAWILIAPEDQFPSLQAQWKGDRPWFRELTDDNPAVLVTMQHATIAQLSKSLHR